nr:putative ribonuclease H-like domain-containing protein [Tanacetum cinerariifolium]
MLMLLINANGESKLLKLMLPRSLEKNTKCVNVAAEELSACYKDAAKLKLKLLMINADAATTYSDSDYAGASLDRKSTTGGCQFLGCRLISWQCKKQTVVATSSTEAEYVAAASGCAQVLWIQNQ